MFDASWWVFGAVVSAVTAIVWLTFRSLGKWQQPPSDKGSEAESAEMFLNTTSKTSGYSAF